MIIDSNGEFRANFVVSMVVMIYSESCCFHDKWWIYGESFCVCDNDDGKFIVS